MSDKQTFYASTPTRSRVDGRLVAIAVFVAILVLEFGLIRIVGPMEPPALDPQTLVGP